MIFLQLRRLSTVLACVAAAACSQSLERSRLQYAPPVNVVQKQGVRALTYRRLHSFGYGSDGSQPVTSLLYVNGALYGTTLNGGAVHTCTTSCGTIFSISLTGTHYRVLHSFGLQQDGYYPGASLIERKDVLYGTTLNGGAHGYGTAFRITTAGAEHVLYSFGKGSDGRYPQAALTNVNGTFYGTTLNGGTNDLGTVFRLSSNGVEEVLHSFGRGSDGAIPVAGLVDVNGTLYGTTYFGGAHNGGTVFRLATTGTENVLYSFGDNSSDGYYPQGNLAEIDGTLYGTALDGGNVAPPICQDGCGVVFSITTRGSEKVLYAFAGSPGGANPEAGLAAVRGALYGTTSIEGASCCGGTAFEISPRSNQETVLHNFAAGYGKSKTPDGINPVANLIDVNGTLYGTTYGGGTYGYGTVFALTP
jgi:uncharacterized repeat protein (TIGR03803 family)